MEFRKPLILSFSLLAFGSASALAQSQAQPPQSQQQERQQQQRQSQMDPGNARTSELIGTKVTDRQGKDIGEIEDVVIDLQGGKVHAAVLSFGGFLGIGEKHFAFPVSELKPGKEDPLTLDIDKQKLENREGFAQGQWPGMDDEYWGRVGGQGKAAVGGGAGQAQKMTLVRASELEGRNVSDNSGKEVGEIRDVIVDLNRGEVKSIAIEVQDGGGQAMVKPGALAQGTGDKLLVSMSADELKSRAQPSQRERRPQRPGPATGGGASSTQPGSGYGK